MRDMMYAVFALISIAAAVGCYFWYVGQGDAETASLLPFIGVVVCAVMALIFGALFLSGRVNKTEEIHITE